MTTADSNLAGTPGSPRFASQWLTLREPADAAARAPELLGPLRAYLDRVRRPGEVPAFRDLGCGTGSMGRWLAARLGGPQRWIMCDRDPALLARVGARMPRRSADGGRVEVTTEQRDITRLSSGDLAGTALVCGSALLDLLTEDEVHRLASACAEAACPVLLALSVVGEVVLEPADPLDAEFTAAFNAHQRRNDGGRRLLGPDAVDVAAAAFERHGARVHTRVSPWRLGADQAGLAEQWLLGWVAAACAQRPALARCSERYVSRRLVQCRSGALRVTVGHRDLLALPCSLGSVTL
ncbi:class I SAM-dependent methyltransferase [Streptomyces yunnanensis]|uniref:Class I SAM-dependent methyltransferase n=1 Tax=Streptomyces yunnanensis TaxID=156453 RepID=A0ABY7ZZ24_9ACTN|nr:class I SAM-dependent methyltransferase [Streptomyces yunnanensis]WEB37927.1 class I SAM-dependent methyltransferase [Streptomyces yunnanensis]WEB45499.1 class I SAM-dependent methyltransferase [Streptomyces yunnanensis]